MDPDQTQCESPVCLHSSEIMMPTATGHQQPIASLLAFGVPPVTTVHRSGQGSGGKPTILPESCPPPKRNPLECANCETSTTLGVVMTSEILCVPMEIWFILSDYGKQSPCLLCTLLFSRLPASVPGRGCRYGRHGSTFNRRIVPVYLCCSLKQSTRCFLLHYRVTHRSNCMRYIFVHTARPMIVGRAVRHKRITVNGPVGRLSNQAATEALLSQSACSRPPVTRRSLRVRKTHSHQNASASTARSRVRSGVQISMVARTVTMSPGVDTARPSKVGR
ncbi:hypothetical protein EDB86DRAFT_1124190 [Lactarius hatsudake]|nr:hypothetical protein EDB86DRAFT_1124190 [Lactarius hatsudake]